MANARSLLLFPLLAVHLAAATVERPNIVFILSDDQGWADIGYQSPDVKTPNMDRLAAAGVRLDWHYVYPTCSPTRVALISGRYPSRHGVLAPLGATTLMPGGEAHLPQQLRDLGYSTHISGKWHIGETPEHRPLRYGFSSSYGYLRGQIDPYTHRYKFGNHVTWHRNDEFIEEDGHVTRLITDEAIRVIEAAGNRPFFLYVAHHSPHYPLNESPEWIEPFEKTIEDPWRRHQAAAIAHMDFSVGRIVAALERTGKRRNTLLIFSSDNGGQRSWPAPQNEYNARYAPHTTLGDNRPLRGWKTDLYEGGIRVPAFVNWPGVLPSGVVVDSPLHITDWAPTLITLAGGKLRSEWKLDGVDIWNLLTGEGRPAGERTLYWRTPNGTAVRHGEWKLIHRRSDDRVELFHLGRDPYEKNDLAASNPDQVRILRGHMERLAADDRTR
jgi:arylsulfatase A-like enzyme